MSSKMVAWKVFEQRFTSLHPADFFSLRSMSYMMQRAWVFILFLNVGAYTLTATNDPVPQMVYILSTVVLVITLLGAAISPNAHIKFLTHSKRRWIGPVLTTLGTCLTFLLYADGVPTEPVGIVAALCMGYGSGLIDLGYGEIYRNQPPDRTCYEVPFVTLLAAAIFAITSEMPPLPAKILTAILPLASGYILLVTNKVWDPKYQRKALPAQINVRTFTWRIGLCACVVGAVDSFTRQIYISAYHVPINSFLQPGMLLSCVIMYLLLAGYRLLAHTPSYRGMYQFVTFTMAVVFMALPVFTSAGVLENTIMQVSYNSFNVLMWLLLSELAYNYRLSSLVVFGIGWGMVSLGVAIGPLAANLLISEIGVLTSHDISVIALVVTTITLASYMFILPERDMENITKMPEGSVVEIDHETTPQASSEEEDDESFVPIPFSQRCALIAQRYDLTPRETEIMTLYARGRSSARIQEELVISHGTVSTHLQHIYQKIGVHSKQELLDIIDGYKSET